MREYYLRCLVESLLADRLREATVESDTGRQGETNYTYAKYTVYYLCQLYPEFPALLIPAPLESDFEGISPTLPTGGEVHSIAGVETPHTVGAHIECFPLHKTLPV